jgi:hypothetical protein
MPKWHNCPLLGVVDPPRSLHTGPRKSVFFRKDIALIKPDRRQCPFRQEGQINSRLRVKLSDCLKIRNFDFDSLIFSPNFAKSLDDAIV